MKERDYSLRQETGDSMKSVTARLVILNGAKQSEETQRSGWVKPICPEAFERSPRTAVYRRCSNLHTLSVHPLQGVKK